MKIILAGATGFIGSAVLTSALAHPSITSILILTRRPLPPNPASTSHPKCKTILLSSFTSYPREVLAELRTASAAIWCVGTFTGDSAVDVTYPLALLDALDEAGAERVRYVHLGGAFTEPPPKEEGGERALWFFVNGRRVRGLAEARVRERERKGEDGVEVFVVRPAAVTAEGGWVMWAAAWVLGKAWSVRMDILAAAMVRIALEGGERRVLENSDVWRIGEEALRG